MTRMMNIVASATLIALTGCQTRITATKNPENVLPIQSVATLNGTNVLITTAYEKASGGWEATGAIENC